MKKITIMISTLFLSTVVLASGIKIGLTTAPASYQQYSKGMNVGVQVGEFHDYKAQLPSVFKETSVAPKLDQEVGFGVVAGFVLSTLAGDDSDVNSYGGGIMLGVYATLAVTSLITIMPELYYAMMGTEFDGFDNKLRFAYIMLPILALYNVNSQFRVGLGPYFGFLLSAKDKFENENEDVKDFVSGFDFGFKLAVIYQASSYINLALAYTRGISNIRESGSSKNYNQAFMLTVCYSLAHLMNQ